jgi:hypothetical protein
MIGKSLIRLADQRSVKRPLRNAGLVSRDKQNGFALRVEGIGNAPNALVGLEAQLFHVCVIRAIQSVGPRTFQVRTEHGQKLNHCRELVLHRLGEGFKLRQKLFMKLDDPVSFKLDIPLMK